MAVVSTNRQLPTAANALCRKTHELFDDVFELHARLVPAIQIDR